MNRLKERLVALARAGGADLVGVTTRARLLDAPPSGDPAYILPSARAVIALGVALDPEIGGGFLSKRDWLSHCVERKAIAQRLYRVGDALAELLRREGHEALNVDLNSNYRPEDGADDVTEYTRFDPEFSHRYAAVAAGLGRLGWSGNLMTPEFGSLVELGSVITSAELAADPVLADEAHPCDRCKCCSLVCPVEMISPKEEMTVTLAGVTERIAVKRPNTLCWIGCSGYEGAARSGRWSNWSPYRLGQPLPRDKPALDALCTKLQKADPQLRPDSGEMSSLVDYRQAVFDPEWFYYTVCGFCRSVCHPERRERQARQRLVVSSGGAALAADGSHVVAEEVSELATPYELRVVVPAEQAPPRKSPASAPGRSPLDRAVLRWLRERASEPER